jgi:prevent-host-death family protein
MKIGIRDLKNRAPQVVREVRESGETAEITYRGQVVAWLTPAASTTGTVEYKAAWKTLDDVAREIGRRTKARKSAKTAEWRRDL